jgi:NADH-quinone oxidoreductase subunit K
MNHSILDNLHVNNYLILSVILFAIGVMGVLFRRNTIIIFMCIELMLNAVNLLLVAFSAMHGDPGGQVMVFFIMAVAAAEVAVGLAILVMIFRNVGGVDINLLNKLKW